MKSVIILSCILCFYHQPIFSWNAVGHRLIAQIAYDYMNQETKQFFNQANRFNHSPSLINASTWLDRLPKERNRRFKSMHYIDIPYNPDNLYLPKSSSVNAVYAIKQSTHVLENRTATSKDKMIAVRVLWHVVGDIHQPLHTITRISQQYPEGDRGGNLLILTQNSVAPNLHAYWDRAGGWLCQKRHYTNQDIKQLASRIEAKWACDLTKTDLNPNHWANESHQLAIDYAYARIPSNRNLNKAYQIMTKRVMIRQIALAGCRLAALSESIAQSSGITIDTM